MNERKTDTTSVFALTALALAVLAMLATVVVAVGGFGSSSESEQPNPGEPGADDDAVADPSADPTIVVTDAAAAMADVTSVEFRLQREGAPIFIDEFERIALDALHGQFAVPGQAQAQLDVTVNGDLATRLGAIAIDDEVWISNPVTGDFETLPAGYDIDPSKFFDPEGGWQPLLASLQNVTLVGIDDRGGERYHLRGTAPAEQVSNITVGLVRGQDVVVDLWIHPDTSLVTAAEFDTELDDGIATWKLELDRYGDEFVIEPPANVRARDTGEDTSDV